MDYITTANVLLWVFLTVAFYFVFLSHWLVSASLFPEFTEKCQEQYRRPVIVTLVGLMATVVPIVAGVLITNVAPPALKWIGIAIASAPIIGGLFGSAGLARKVGVGMPTPIDEAQPWRRVLRGGSALALTFLLPLFGQFIVIPLVIASGVGAGLMARFSKRNSGQTPALAAAQPPVMPTVFDASLSTPQQS